MQEPTIKQKILVSGALVQQIPQKPEGPEKGKERGKLRTQQRQRCLALAHGLRGLGASLVPKRGRAGPPQSPDERTQEGPWVRDRASVPTTPASYLLRAESWA